MAFRQKGPQRTNHSSGRGIALDPIECICSLDVQSFDSSQITMNIEAEFGVEMVHASSAGHSYLCIEGWPLHIVDNALRDGLST
jgi:hypothetical protein